ncbi:hypothetical protein L596_029678 [Steinernema carpocapsae]|nr:hypothetical protein L596_029678 [Steinernema carpocapsae]
MVVKGDVICGPQPGYPEPAPAKTTCCPPGGKGLWSNWRDWSFCASTTCGGCQIRTRKRICSSAAFGCPCVGPISEKVIVASNLVTRTSLAAHHSAKLSI